MSFPLLPRSRAPLRFSHPGLAVFLITLAVYAALVPWMVRVWQRTGDEPHYLLAAHSLAFDGDLDLANNYARRDYLSFYGDANLTPHTRPGPNGQAVLTHNLGLSFLIAPAYRPVPSPSSACSSSGRCGVPGKTARARGCASRSRSAGWLDWARIPSSASGSMGMRHLRPRMPGLRASPSRGRSRSSGLCAAS